MTRHAILLANTATSADKRLSVTATQARRYVSDVAALLGGLGSFAFKAHEIVDRPYDDALSSLRKAFQRASKDVTTDGNESSCVLFYYFGHGVLREQELYFVCKDSSTAQTATMIAFRDVAAMAFGFGLPRVLFVVDCCYAGAATYSLSASAGSGHRYAILASAIASQRAQVKPDRVPFGAFSVFLFNGLRDVDACETGSEDVTVGALFRYTRERLADDGYAQQPHKVDSGLDDLVLCQASVETVVSPPFNTTAPRKSTYRKVFWIAAVLRSAGPMTSRSLYRKVTKERPVEFLTPFKTATGTKYEPVSEATFEQYVGRMQSLGILEVGESLRLSSVGRTLIAGEGRAFNTVLVDLIDLELKRQGTSKERIAKLVRFKAKSRGIPTAAELYLDARRLDSLSMQPEWFATVLDLLGHAGFLRYAARKTFFPR